MISSKGPSIDPAWVDRLPKTTQRVKEEVARIIVGQDHVVEEILMAFLAGGHVLLEGVPGLAKTLLVNTLASALSMTFGRVQFTPDLMPSDLTGSQMMQDDHRRGQREFVFRRGSIFAHVLLADEINRCPPKTQAALLEGMEEGTVTVGGKNYALPSPFFVLATQNPIEQEGTYPLPEAQLDRFLIKVLVDYPTLREEWQIVDQTTSGDQRSLSEVLSRDDILAWQAVTRALPVSSHVLDYIARLVRRTRPSEKSAPDWIRHYCSWGAGTRAALALTAVSKARTLLRGRFAVTREDVRATAPLVLRHRILPSFHAEAENISTNDLVDRLLNDTPAFAERYDYDAATKSFLRL